MEHDDKELPNDAQTPPQPTPPFTQPATPETPPTEEADAEKKPYVVQKSTLDLLPERMKKEMHELIAQGCGGARVKKAIEDRYLGKTDILPVTKETYDNYIRAHKKDIFAAAELQKGLVTSTKESLQDVKEVLDTTLDMEVSLQDKQAAFTKLFQRCEKRITLIEAFNSSFLTPQMEQVIGAYTREQRAILETLVKFQEQLNSNSDELIFKSFESLSYVWLATVVNVYKTIHRDEKLDEFQGLLKEELQKATDAYAQQLARNKK